MNEIRDVKPLAVLWRKHALRQVAARDDDERHRQSQSDQKKKDDNLGQDEVIIDEYA